MRKRAYTIKYKILTIIAVSCIMFLSCAENSVIEVFTRPDGTYITLRLKQDHGTRTMTPSEPDDKDESLITNAALFFFDSNHNLVSNVFVNDIEWVFDENGGYGSSNPVKLHDDMPYGSYRVYVVANAAGSIDLSRSATLSGFAGAYDISGNTDAIFTPGNFIMANRQDEITNPGKANGGVLLVLEPHKTKGTFEDPIKIEVTLERVAAKVTVDDTASSPAVVGTALKGSGPKVTVGHLEIDKFALINCTNRFNLIQQWKPGGRFTSPEGRDMLVVSPSSDTGYPIGSGYYNRPSELSPAKFTGIENPLYCLENNSPYYVEELGITGSNALPKTKMKGRATAVVFSAQATLSGSGGDTFYRYKHTLYSDLNALRADYPDEITDSDGIADLRADGVEVFENGAVYYTYWIRDSNYTDGGDNYYAVIRNTWYRLGISDIIDIGDDVPGGKSYKEEDPIDGQSAIAVNIRISSWNIIPENEHTLGGEDVVK